MYTHINCKELFFLFAIFLLHSCGDESDFFPTEEGRKIFYKVNYENKEKKTQNFRQNYVFLPKKNGEFFPHLRNDGKVIYYKFIKQGIKIEEIEYIQSELAKKPKNKMAFEKGNLLLKFPIKNGASWKTRDQTTIIMKFGFDRIFETLLNFELQNKIVETNVTVNLEGRKFRNCVKVVGKGTTSYNAGPPLGNINIEITSNAWFSRDYGLIKLTREEKSNSETMGRIFYEKTMVVDD